MRALLAGFAVLVVTGVGSATAAGGANDRSSATTSIVVFSAPHAAAVCAATRFHGERPILRCNARLRRLPPKPASCELDWGGGLEMDNAGRPSVLCASDSGFNPQGAAVLAYGRVWRHFTFTCWSRPTGLTCRNPAGHGWTLSRTGWRTF